MIRIIIIDDHPVVLEGLSSGLRDFPGIEVTGTATGAGDARKLIEAGVFDILLTDLNLPEPADGLELIEYAASLEREFRIVVLTYSNRPEDVFNANRAGACAYLIKDADLDEIAEALAIVHDGGRPPLTPELEEALWQKLRNSRPAEPPYGMTEREWDILKLMASGATNEEIAAQLFLSPRVVRRSNTSLYRKLEVRNRSEAIAKAVSEELFGLR
jgi:DNA-binding NarL/FixJ family response regulator